jgi:hypothetical protein
MAKLDITRTNDAVTRLLEVTENPRHRFMLLTYYRHRFLEIAGRYEEIFAPTMMADNPAYHFRALGITARLEGQDQVKGLRPVGQDRRMRVLHRRRTTRDR